MKPITLTAHASQKAGERGIRLDWVSSTVRSPLWTLPDGTDSDQRRCFRPIPENGGRILQVVCVETASEIRVITVFFDRDARPPWPT